MSTSWIPSHTNLPEHPKTLRAARALDVDVPTMVGLLHCFWYWVTDYAPDGDLSRHDALDIAIGARWDGDPQRFVQALVDAGGTARDGFLEHTDDGGLVVHDWQEAGGKLEARREASAKANHTRHHVNEGVTAPDCKFCPSDRTPNGRPTGLRTDSERTPESPQTLRTDSDPDSREEKRREEHPPPNPPPEPDPPTGTDPDQEEGRSTTDRQIKAQVQTTLDHIRHQLPDHITLNGNRRRLETALHPLIVNGWTPDQIAKELTAQQLDDVGNTYAVLTHRATALHDQPSPASIRQRAERRWRDTVHMLDTRFDPKNEPEDDRPQGATG